MQGPLEGPGCSRELCNQASVWSWEALGTREEVLAISLHLLPKPILFAVQRACLSCCLIFEGQKVHLEIYHACLWGWVQHILIHYKKHELYHTVLQLYIYINSLHCQYDNVDKALGGAYEAWLEVLRQGPQFLHAGVTSITLADALTGFWGVFRMLLWVNRSEQQSLLLGTVWVVWAWLAASLLSGGGIDSRVNVYLGDYWSQSKAPSRRFGREVSWETFCRLYIATVHAGDMALRFSVSRVIMWCLEQLA